MYNYYEQFAAWEKYRIGRFTSSEIWRLFKRGRGKDEYFGEVAKKYIRNKTAEILTQEKVGQDLEGIPSVEWGISNEMAGVLEFEQRTGLKVTYYGKGNPKFFEFSTLSGGSPDGEIVEHDAVIEVKAPYNSGEHFDHLLLASASDLLDCKPEYYYQIQANILFMNRSKGYFISYDPRYPVLAHQLKILEIQPDEAVQIEMKERISEAEKQVRLNLELLKDVSYLIAEHDFENDVTIIQ